MKNSNIAMVLMGSITLIATAAAVAMGTHEDHVTPAPIQTAPPPGTWSLIITDTAGHSDVIDWNLTFSDCTAYMDLNPEMPGISCERQPDGVIPG